MDLRLEGSCTLSRVGPQEVKKCIAVPYPDEKMASTVLPLALATFQWWLMGKGRRRRACSPRGVSGLGWGGVRKKIIL